MTREAQRPIQTALILTPLAVLLFLYGMGDGRPLRRRAEALVSLMVAQVVITPFVTYSSPESTWFAFDLAMGGLDLREQREAEEAVTAGSRPT